jgi:hypothetical protein
MDPRRRIGRRKGGVEALMKLRPFAFLLAASAGSLSAATFTVSKDGRGTYATIQAAVDKAGFHDVVEILDTATYNEQVTLRAPLHHLVLRSANPSSARKPVIRWQDNENIGPKTCQESLIPGKITYELNGALRLIDVRDVRIEGIAIDGGGPTVISWPNVWGNGINCTGALFPLFHGNTGLLVFRSSQVVVTGCEFANAYFGAHIKDRDPLGPFAPRPGYAPFTRMASGNHIFAGNSIHHNTWGVFMESAWGLGSTFRDNLVYENHHATPAAAAAVRAASSEGLNQPGGAFFFKDGQQSSMTLHNNTFWHNFLELAGGYRAGAQHLLVNNVFAEPNIAWSKDPYFGNSFMALDPYLAKRMKYNAYAGHTSIPVVDSLSATASMFDSATQQTVTAGKMVYFSGLVVRIMNNMPGLSLDTASVLIDVPLAGGVKQARVPLEPAVYAGRLLQGDPTATAFTSAEKNRWVETRFRSVQPTDPGFLMPTPASQELLGSGWDPLRYPASGSPSGLSGLGALPPASRPQALLRIVPLAPVLVEGGQMVLRFSVQAWNGEPAANAAAPVITYLRVEKNMPTNSNSFGGMAGLQLPEAEAIPVPAAPIRYGYNEVKLPQSGLKADSNALGFVEMAVQSMGTLSNVAQFPILPLVSRFTVEALDETQDIPAAGFAPGKTFRLRIALANSSASMHKVHFSLASGAGLKFISPANADSAGSVVAQLPFTAQVQFTETPDDGVELIWAAAYRDTVETVTGFGQSRALAFDVTTSFSAHGKKKPALKPMDILKRRNLMGRKIRPR